MTDVEDIRHSLLAHLYRTRAIRVPTGYLQRHVKDDCGAEPAAVTTEIMFLMDAGLIDSKPDAVGSSDYWKLTAAGVLQHERRK